MIIKVVSLTSITTLKHLSEKLNGPMFLIN